MLYDVHTTGTKPQKVNFAQILIFFEINTPYLWVSKCAFCVCTSCKKFFSITTCIILKIFAIIIFSDTTLVILQFFKKVSLILAKIGYFEQIVSTPPTQQNDEIFFSSLSHTITLIQKLFRLMHEVFSQHIFGCHVDVLSIFETRQVCWGK